MESEDIVKVGNNEINVKKYRNDWALALMSQGVIVKLSVNRWRATAPLKVEELGLRFIDNEGLDFLKKYVKLGNEKLLPPEVISEIECIETKARRILKEHSFDTVWGYFVPYTAFEKWEKANLEIKNDFYEAARILGERYDDIIHIVSEEYKKMANDCWCRHYPNQGNATESFISDFVSKIISKIPSRNDIIASFKYDTTYFIIPMPSMLEEDISRIQEIKQEREFKRFENELEKDTRKKIAEEYIKRKQELIDGFLEATVVSMRKYVAELCESVIESIHRVHKNGEQKDITNLQKIKIQKMIKKVRLLNFHSDTEIKKLLDELNEEVEKFKGARDKNIVIQKLQNIVDAGKDEFLPSDYNQSIGSLEI